MHMNMHGFVDAVEAMENDLQISFILVDYCEV